MLRTTIEIAGQSYPLITVNTAIVGSGAASLNCALQLTYRGEKDLLIITEKIGGGTSNNTGSDKQTYYKLSLSGSGADSTVEMAESLYNGGSMHGDIALIEATLSAQSFYHLVSLGVPFPHDSYGGFVGYKTDHDPRQRATSAGPKTSMLMFEALYREVERRELPILNECEVIGILTCADDAGEERTCGLICLEKARLHDETHGLLIINAGNIVYGTGGPAVIYQDSVYPEVHTGASGVALEAGIPAQNLTEWQYGLASTEFRWNVSGTYQQVIPRYISTDADGNDEQEFLNPFFPTMEQLTSDIFLKGYQWPFDPRKVLDYGSSIIDILVYNETVLRGRRVFMDFRANPSNSGNPQLRPFALDELGEEAARYLQSSNAMLPTPIERLQKMNPLAIELYLEHGIDIRRQPLEVAVCAQHHNGGLQGNIWWESPIKHFFSVGEANGSHGVYRPGGSALNSGQCGSLRAAQYISARYKSAVIDNQQFLMQSADQLQAKISQLNNLFETGGSTAALMLFRQQVQQRMTANGAHIRDAERIKGALLEAREQMQQWQNCGVDNPEDLPIAMKNRDAIICQIVILSAMAEYLLQGGVSRGSYLVIDQQGELPCAGLDDSFRFRLGEDKLKEVICECRLLPAGTVDTKWVPRREVPQQQGWFENVWADYRADKIIR